MICSKGVLAAETRSEVGSRTGFEPWRNMARSVFEFEVVVGMFTADAFSVAG